jgi:hypothetical protein
MSGRHIKDRTDDHIKEQYAEYDRCDISSEYVSESCRDPMDHPQERVVVSQKEASPEIRTSL